MVYVSKSLCYILETYAVVYVNHISIKMEEKTHTYIYILGIGNMRLEDHRVQYQQAKI